MTKQRIHIAFAGGGSGGHVQPIVSLVEYAQKHSDIIDKCKLYRYGEKKSQEQSACAALEDVVFTNIHAGKWRRYGTIAAFMSNIKDIVFLGVGFLQSLRLLKKQGIDVVFCKGGYVALPVCVAAWCRRIPVVLHESDTHPGLTNRIVARRAHTRCVGFTGVFADELHVGQLLSEQLLEYEHIAASEQTQILIMGGSQGAAKLYEALIALCTTQTRDMQFHVLLGTKNSGFHECLDELPWVICYDFLDQQALGQLYAQCDVSITRGSATSLAEQQLFGIKKIIVPLPRTGGNHQWHNALWYGETYDDIIIEQDDQLVAELAIFLTALAGRKKEKTMPDTQDMHTSKQRVRDALLAAV